MKTQRIGQSEIETARIAVGCMRMATLSTPESARVIDSSMALGMNFFDHADIYGQGQSEIIFAQGLQASAVSRENIFLQSKCGIRPGYFDFSKEHLLSSVEGSLKRLNTDYLDVLVLHRPDALMDPEEVAEAFIQLKEQGKVRYFGVSNQNRYQIELLQSYVKDSLIVNQVQMSPAHTPLIDAGLAVNMHVSQSVMKDAGTIEYCRLNHITLQAWSPFQVDLNQGLIMSHPKYQPLADTIRKYAEQYHVVPETIIVSWLLRHPAKMQVIIGSMNPERLENIAKADNVSLSRQEWYDIYTSAGNILP